MLESKTCLEAINTGDTKVIMAIYSKVLPRVIRFVYQNRGNEDDAREVFQNALLQLAVRYKKDKFTIKTSFESYLFTVCKNLWRRELNRSKREVTNHKLIEHKDENDDLAFAIIEQKKWELFNEYMGKLSDNCKSVMNLFLKKVAYAEIMRVFGYKSETVARQRVFKCKSKLKSLITKDERYHTLRDI